MEADHERPAGAQHAHQLADHVVLELTPEVRERQVAAQHEVEWAGRGWPAKLVATDGHEAPVLGTQDVPPATAQGAALALGHGSSRRLLRS